MSDNSIYTPVKSIDEEFTRCNHTPNAQGLTQVEIEQRDRDTAEMMRLYPKLNPLWADMIWNFVKRTPPERINEIIDNKEFEGKPVKEYMTGGILQLAAFGAEDLFFIGNPQITFFKTVYRRHTNFSVETIENSMNGNFGFGNRLNVQFSVSMLQSALVLNCTLLFLLVVLMRQEEGVLTPAKSVTPLTPFQ